METNRNYIIAALVALLVISSIWGSIGNRSAKANKKELQTVTAELETLKVEKAKPVEAAPDTSKGLVKELKAKEEQLVKARKELVELRKGVKALEVELINRDAKVQKLQAAVAKVKAQKGSEANSAVAALQAELKKTQTALKQKNQQLQQATKKLKKAGADLQQLQATSAGKAGNLEQLQQKLAASEEALKASEEALNAAREQAASATSEEREMIGKLVSDYEIAGAQIIGLEKIIEEKNAALEETSRELDRVKINMDVLLAKISDQQDTMQELHEENRELVKDLTGKNQQLADLQDQLLQAPVQK